MSDFEKIWPRLMIPGEFDLMDATDQGRWRDALKQAYEAGLDEQAQELAALREFHKEWMEDFNAWQANRTAVFHKFSIEHLYHFQCGNDLCKKWWTIGDFQVAIGQQKTVTCPFCSFQQFPKPMQERDE